MQYLHTYTIYSYISNLLTACQETFGFIHLRNITASISSWSTVLAEAYRFVLPPLLHQSQKLR